MLFFSLFTSSSLFPPRPNKQRQMAVSPEPGFVHNTVYKIWPLRCHLLVSKVSLWGLGISGLETNNKWGWIWIRKQRHSVIMWCWAVSHKEGMPQKCTGEKACWWQSAVWKHSSGKLTGRKKSGKKSCTSKGSTAGLRGSSWNMESKAGLRLMWVQQEPPASEVFRKGAPTVANLKPLLNNRQCQKSYLG